MTYGLFLTSEAIQKVIGRQGASILVRRHGHPPRRPLGRARHERPGDSAMGEPAEAVATGASFRDNTD
jgi:hypothetical protein